MRKNFLALLLITCLLLIVPLNDFEIFVKASSETWIVDAGGKGNFTKIQDAVNAADSGDIIYVYNGTYHENVVVNKSVSIVGKDRDRTIIDGSGSKSVVTVTANNVTIQNFTIMNSGTAQYDSGVFITNSIGSIITQNNITKSNDGIRLNYSSNNLISDNTMFLNYYGGIFLHSSDDNLISNNKIYSNYYAIYLYSSRNNILFRNALSSNFYGIYFYFSNDNFALSNTVSFNIQAGLHITFYSGNNTFYHNNFDNGKNFESDFINTWDFDGEGNFWSDYAGQDSNYDGIGDAPHILDEYNHDNYPLMGTFSDFDIVAVEGTYTASIISNSSISGFKFEVGVETGNRILSFNATDSEGSSGFCRIKISRDLMEYPHIVLVDSSEVALKILALDEAYVCLYFQYPQNSQVTIISSRTASLYYELLDKYLALNESFYDLNASFYALNATYFVLFNNYTRLQMQLFSLNETYVQLLSNFSVLQLELYTLNQTYDNLLANYTQLQKILEALNEDYSELQGNHSLLLGGYIQLQKDFGELQASLQVFNNLNATYYTLLNSYNLLLENYVRLQDNFDVLNSSYVDHLSEYSNQIQNTKSLVYIFIAITTMFIIVTVYLSRRAHSSAAVKTKIFEEKEKEQS